mgnify:FL=1
MRIRKARLSDCKLYWKWANDPIVRANAFEARPIPWQTHIVWFKEKLEDHNSTLLLMEIENEPIGQVRFEHTTDGYFIDFSISSTHRNRGLGLILLSSGINHLKNSQQITFWGEVKKSNRASKAIFEKLEFERASPIKKGTILYRLKV